MRKMVFAVLVVSMSGCIGASTVLRRASFDLECPEERLSIEPFDQYSWGVAGCGHKAIYKKNWRDESLYRDTPVLPTNLPEASAVPSSYNGESGWHGKPAARYGYKADQTVASVPGFAEGFKVGYKDGYCAGVTYCPVPYPDRPPRPELGDDTFIGGYRVGLTQGRADIPGSEPTARR